MWTFTTPKLWKKKLFEHGIKKKVFWHQCGPCSILLLKQKDSASFRALWRQLSSWFKLWQCEQQLRGEALLAPRSAHPGWLGTAGSLGAHGPTGALLTHVLQTSSAGQGEVRVPFAAGEVGLARMVTPPLVAVSTIKCLGISCGPSLWPSTSLLLQRKMWVSLTVLSPAREVAGGQVPRQHSLYLLSLKDRGTQCTDTQLFGAASPSLQQLFCTYVRNLFLFATWP